MPTNRYTFNRAFTDDHVTLEVDLDKLTPQMATEINMFFGGGAQRLRACDGDVVQAVLRLFAARALSYFMGNGGIDTSDLGVAEASDTAQDVINHQGEGWYSAQEMGLSIRGGYVDMPSFSDMVPGF